MPIVQERTKRETRNIRIKPELRGLIDRAAELTGRNRTDFVLDAARRAAEDALLDGTVFAADRKTYAEFVARRRPRRAPIHAYAAPCKRRRHGRSKRDSIAAGADWRARVD